MIQLIQQIKLTITVVFILSIHFIKIEAQSFIEQTGISLPGVYGGSIAWGDYDNDGDLDILLIGKTNTGNRISKIYRNNGNNTFAEQTSIVLEGVDIGSAAWGDYNNDGNLDILLTGANDLGIRISKIYRNNGDNSFSEQTNILLTAVYESSVAWGDYDNDGNLDILLAGYDVVTNTCVSKIYRNNGNNGFTEQTNISLEGVANGSVAWGDYDNDGDLDILLAGVSHSSIYISKIYRNNGNNNFTEQTIISLPGMYGGSVAWGDYDSDGYLDILLAGETYTNGLLSKIYRNNGNNSFTEQTGISLTDVVGGKGVWGDYDNDGDLDILLSGVSGTSLVSKIYKNNGNNSFTLQTGISFAGANNICWGDYDNDGDLDIIIGGELSSGLIFTKIYKNTVASPNTVPAAPTGLNYSVNGTDVVLRWKPVKTDATAAKGLTYNVRVGKSSMRNNVLSPMSDSINGFRRVVSMGNAQTDTSFVLRNLKEGTYYWSVQAIDNNYAGGAFAPEQTFTFTAKYPASNLLFQKISSTNVKLSWTRGNGDNCIVFAKENGSDLATPANNTNYIANKAFGKGAQLGSSGWYCVYNGPLDTLSVTEMKPLTNYIFHVLEYKGSTGMEQYSTVDEPTAHSTLTTDLFTEQKDILPNVISDGSAVWGDYNNDGFPDILFIPRSYGDLKIYRNNGNNSFTEQTGISFVKVTDASATWGDYDNDGYLDLLVSGVTYSGAVTKIYRNNGDNTFSEQTGISLIGVSRGTAVWNDYDKDGKLDIFLAGNTDSKGLLRIYHNNGNNSFTQQADFQIYDEEIRSAAWGDYDNDGVLDVLLLVENTHSYYHHTNIYKNNSNNSFSVTNIVNRDLDGSIAWGDYDNDGDLDILLSGITLSSTLVSLIYKNDGNNTFTEQTGIYLKGIFVGTAVWGDYDNDGNLDILLAGDTFKDMISKTYHNNGDNTFTEQIAIKLATVERGSVSWADYDNDGDLDILLIGETGNGRITKIYRNDLDNTATPAAPAYTINYAAETTAQAIPATHEYSTNADMTLSVNGNGSPVVITPGTNLYIRAKGTATKEASAIQTLIVPSRPSVPTYTINFINESTTENVAVADQYSTYSNMSVAITGTNAKVTITPGQNMYFRKAATSANFASLMQTLQVPAQPEAPSAPVVNDIANTFDWTFVNQYPNVNNYEYSLNNGTTWTNCIAKPIMVGNLQINSGFVKVRIKATSGNFKGNNLASDAAFNIGTGIVNLTDAGINFFPNPVCDVLHIEDINAKSLISIYTIQGVIVKQLNLEGKKLEVPVNNLPAGTYILIISSEKILGQIKFIKK